MMGRMLLVVLLLSVEGVHGVAADTRTEYDANQTVEDCMNMLTSHGTSLTCSMLTPYVKCLIKVSMLYQYPPGDYRYPLMATVVNSTLGNLGSNCQFDIAAMSAEVANEQSGRTDPKTTISHVSVADSDYDGDQTVGDCLNTLQRLSGQGTSLSCSLFNPYIKCVVRVSEIYKYPAGDSQYTAMDDRLHTTLETMGLNCNFDLQAISAEVAREQNAKNSDPGFITSSPGMLVLLLSLICSYIFQF